MIYWMIIRPLNLDFCCHLRNEKYFVSRTYWGAMPNYLYFASRQSDESHGRTSCGHLKTQAFSLVLQHKENSIDKKPIQGKIIA